MVKPHIYSLIFALSCTPASFAQTPGQTNQSSGWRSSTTGRTPSGAPVNNVAARPSNGHYATASSSNTVLPRTAGQVWREYDISSFTNRVKDRPNPEQIVIDWILRDTGTQTWFSEPLGILSASKGTIRVYHTPEVQEIVHRVIDRFVHPKAASHALGTRLVTVGSPNWRSRAFSVLRPVDVQTPGVQAWLVSKENAARLLGELRSRSDFQEHQAPNNWIANGHSSTVARANPKSYAHSIRPATQGIARFETVMGRINEGYSLQIDPLLDVNGTTMEAVIKCQVDLVEKFQIVNIEIPNYAGAPQRQPIQVPQVASWRLSERFRWPVDHVLLLSCGIVATPGPEKNSIFGLPNVFDSSPGRADALLFIEARPVTDPAILSGTPSSSTPSSASAPSISYGRY